MVESRQVDEAGETFLFGDDGESFIGTKDVLERPDLFYSAGAFLWPLPFTPEAADPLLSAVSWVQVS